MADPSPKKSVDAVYVEIVTHIDDELGRTSDTAKTMLLDTLHRAIADRKRKLLAEHKGQQQIP